MGWKEAIFKDKKVWVQVDEKGNPLVRKGLSPIRYSDSEGAKIYSGTSQGIRVVGKKTIELSAGTPKKKTKKGSGLGSAKNRTEAQKEQAKQSARNLVDSFSSDAVLCFTDGSCRGNPGLSGTGVLVRMPSGEEIEHFRFLGQGTNNVAEISAVLDAVHLVEKHKIPDENPVEIMTDSKYVYGLLELGWKAKANRELVDELKKKIRIRGNIRLHWVAGHAGIEENERADRLANRAIEERK